MDYQKIYSSLIERARTRILECYSETHHVTPTCIGGLDTPENKVELTPEEHYVAHQLLVKMHPRSFKLLFAAHMMCSNRPSNKLYGWLRRKHAEAIGKINSGFKGPNGTRWITDGSTNKKIAKNTAIPLGWKLGRTLPRTEIECAFCQKTFIPLSQSKFCTVECKNKAAEMTTWKHTPETKRKYSLLRLGKKRGKYKKHLALSSSG